MNILIINTVGFKFSDENISELRNDFPQHDFIVVDDNAVTNEQVKNAEVMVGFPDPKILKNAVNLKWLHLSSIGVDKHVQAVNSQNGLIDIMTDAIVLASGCMERNRGAISIPGSRCSGVFTAGSAQRYLNMDGYLCGKKVFILGSGDIGLIMARRMTLEGAEVLGVAEIQPYSNGLNRNIVQCLDDFDIPLYLSTTVTKIIGEKRIERIELSKVDENLKPIAGTQREIEVDCLLLSIGLIPDITCLNRLPVEKDARTHSVIVNECNEMTLPGFFACGNALQVHDLVDYASMEGEATGRQVAYYLQEGFVQCEPRKVKAGENISYVVPQRLRIDNIRSDCKFSFRVKKPMKNCVLRIMADDQCIKEIKKRYALPAEMENSGGYTCSDTLSWKWASFPFWSSPACGLTFVPTTTTNPSP